MAADARLRVEEEKALHPHHLLVDLCACGGKEEEVWTKACGRVLD